MEFTNGTIYGGYTGDYRNQIHYARREDGVWFKRYQDNTAYGYRWSAWKAGSEPTSFVSTTGKKARLPKG